MDEESLGFKNVTGHYGNLINVTDMFIECETELLDTEDKSCHHNLVFSIDGLNYLQSLNSISERGSNNHFIMEISIARPNSMPISLQESASYGDNSLEGENPSIDSEEETLAQPPTREQIMALLTDAQREQLTKKLSEANQQNRFLKRQLKVKEDALVKFKSELGVMELEIQALARLAEEIAQCGIPEGSRKINGKYIHSHLVTRLEAVHEKLKEQIKDVDAAQSKEVSVFWIGMAESVQVMGTFDGWSQGEHLSPEYNGSYTKFSTTMLLRPGRYEIKFLVDGEWQLSPEFPIIGEGLTKNNLLVVE
ncbi:Protein PTST-like protein [Vigna angularis]|uniref:Protein PTST-like protein n=2 Tax=Phaseolus angularis TaxID=3914 RepID=A0A8T0L8N8_PHAAN|nr:Protein PTST-like protein [Vigna angularis]